MTTAQRLEEIAKSPDIKPGWCLSICEAANELEALTRERDDLVGKNLALKIERDRLLDCLEPGKANAINEAMFKLADKLGLPPSSWKHALTRIEEHIVTLRATAKRRLELLRQVEGPLSDCAAFGSCDCDIPHGKTCLTCQIAMLHKAIAAELKPTP